jgi:hypothetical protein
MRKTVNAQCKRVPIRPVLRVLDKKVVHQCGIISDVPVNPVEGRIINWLINGVLAILKPTRSIVIHAEEENVAG